MLPRLRLTELLVEVNGWTEFAERFGHLRTGAPPDESVGLMTALLADATNLGLARMARSSKIFSHSKLLWIAEWHVRDETYQAALACLTEAIHAQPFTRVWGDGGTSSSDGQFRAGAHGEARADYNAKYGSEPGVKFYTHVSDRYASFHTKVIAANVSEAAHILDGLLHHECSLDIREHYTNTAGRVLIKGGAPPQLPFQVLKVQTGQKPVQKTVDFLLRAKRDVAAAKAFFRQALTSQGRLPHKNTLDGYQASHRAAREFLEQQGGARIKIRSSKYLTDVFDKSLSAPASAIGSFFQLTPGVFIPTREGKATRE